ncbi:DUF2178 domain-containing protein [Filobacillus milosensis]|uniref:DUF2178 domain-containing protein n=1 Tax=Filobacillus milosensis TaxID=94137 RepID=A0A4Y8IG33_9BACI|nr:DUF2178 domain-containing protein [Filobacillus milosensis]TFB19623.1 DUF2178 domain-containing protein [Filobacillus milosensis]
MTENILIGLTGLGLGVLIALIVYLIQRRVGKKKRWFDERYYKLNNRAKASSWNIMLVILIIAWAVVIIVEGISFSFFLMTAIYLAHCISLAITGAYHSIQEKNDQS